MSKALEEELKERLHIRVLKRNPRGSSGCISTGHCYTTDTDESLFVKTNGGLHCVPMFNGEFEALTAMRATRTIRVPKPLLVLHDYDDSHCSALAMEYVDMSPLTDQTIDSLAKDLASLHDYNNKVARYNQRAQQWVSRTPPSAKAIMEAKRSQSESKSEGSDQEEEEETNQYSKHGTLKFKAKPESVEHKRSDECVEKFVPEPDTEHIDRFGFHIATSCGSIPQVNEWTDDWVSFYARHRLDKAIRSLLSDHGDRELSEQWSHLQLKVGKWFTDYDFKGEDRIVPALLHGDLWSGNLAQLSDGSCGIIFDPGSFYGHSEYDFGIARMFGGIPKEFERSYFEVMPKRKLFEQRNKLYQLFNYLNHWDHFGSGYRAGSLKTLKDLNLMFK